MEPDTSAVLETFDPEQETSEFFLRSHRILLHSVKSCKLWSLKLK